MASSENSRRNFLKKLAIGTATVGMAPVVKAFSQDNDNSNLFNVNLAQPLRTGKSVMGLACEPLKTVRIGLIGIGMRGIDAADRLMQIEGVEIMALCDLVEKNVKDANAILKKNNRKPALEFTGEEDWMEVCRLDNVDLIYTCTPWELHTPIAVYAMKQGKHAATEVPAALTIDQCWQLVNTAEETQRHCMMLENCCYDFFELATLNMARQGVFGEIYHAEGAYLHDLRWLKFDEKTGYHRMWRLDYSKHHTGNPYPTHGLGPVAQIMGINRGDRFDYLTSVSTNQFGMSLYAAEKFGADSDYAKYPYKLGDMNITLLHTNNGKTVMVQHDTTTPRPYSRIHHISGTRGMAVKWPKEAIALEPEAHKFLTDAKRDEMLKNYEHPLAKQIGEKAKKVGGHGGMDFIMDYRLIHCLRNGLPLDQDVYDAATWSSIVQLSELSVLNKGQSIEVPDFTRGAWKEAKPWPVVTI